MLQRVKKGKKNKIGAYGEEIARTFLAERNFALVEQNFLQKWGEIDLIMQKGRVIHFVEVKTVSFADRHTLAASFGDTHRPEEQFTADKYRKLSNTINTWLAKESYQGEYQLDLVTVRVIMDEKYAEVEYFPSVSLN